MTKNAASSGGELKLMSSAELKFAGSGCIYFAFSGRGTFTVAVEAMSCGVACVATDAGADGEVWRGILWKGTPDNSQNYGVAGQLRTLLPVLRGHQELQNNWDKSQS
jgi:glycosyltransferase involved in cell wall biosynthesis